MHGPPGWINNNWINSLNENLTFTTYITVAPGINLMRRKRIKEKGTSSFKPFPAATLITCTFAPHVNLLSLKRLSITFTSNGKRKFVPRNFLSIRIILNCFICSFSILRNSQLESYVCRISETWTLYHEEVGTVKSLLKWWSPCTGAVSGTLTRSLLNPF